MSKKELTAEERVKKYGTSIMGVGIIYVILQVIGIFLNISVLLKNPISLIINVALVIVLILMSVGVSKRERFGITCGWIFESVLILSLVLYFFSLSGGLDIVGLLVAILLPSELTRFSKALEELQ